MVGSLDNVPLSALFSHHNICHCMVSAVHINNVINQRWKSGNIMTHGQWTPYQSVVVYCDLRIIILYLLFANPIFLYFFEHTFFGVTYWNLKFAGTYKYHIESIPYSDLISLETKARSSEFQQLKSSTYYWWCQYFLLSSRWSGCW